MGHVNTPDTSFRQLWVAGVLIHVALLIFILDLYFKSPVTHGMTPFKSSRGFAKRSVIFVADGLRAETLYDPNNFRTPYLNKIRAESSAFGTVHTRVPTESRPGHVAILAGLYEDPSAIFTGWQSNIVGFDSVINQSNYAWSLGSPDIVNIFVKTDSSRIAVDSYNPEDEDFSGKVSTINLDRWVFDKMNKLMTHEDPCLDRKIKLIKQQEQIKGQQRAYGVMREECLTDLKNCRGEFCDVFEKLCTSKITKKQIPLTVDQVNIFNEIIELERTCNATCGQICEEGNIFFLHLLGMDSAGHIHKPNSKEYFENLEAVDEGIRETVEAVETFFSDEETVYIFTSDHGMTNWGSHGDGSDHETKVPYIIWGKGVHTDPKPRDMEQADLTPLIASLIGIAIPINSVGVLHDELLNGSQVNIAEAMYTNVRQIAEQYITLRDEYEKDFIFYTEYKTFRDQDAVEVLLEDLKILLEDGRASKVIDLSHELLVHLKAGISYTQHYYFAPKMFCIMTGFLVWMFALLVSTFHFPQRHKPGTITKIQHFYYKIWKFCTTALFVSSLFLFKIDSSLITFLYPLFPVVVILITCSNENIMYKLFTLRYNNYVYRILLYYMFYVIMIQFLVNSFFDKMHCGFVFTALFMWIFLVNIKRNIKIMWMVACMMLTMLLVIPNSTNFSYPGFIFGIIAWSVFYSKVIKRNFVEYLATSYFKKQILWKVFMNMPYTLFIVSVINSFMVAKSFYNEEGVFLINKVVSWIITGMSLGSIILSPTTIYGRFGQICSCLIVPLTLMSINIDLFTYTIIVSTLYLWIKIEATIFNPNSDLNYLYYNVLYDFTTLSQGSKCSDFRKTFIYISLIIGYYFAIGNIASVNGFDPMWTRAYISTFNPIVMCSLIIFKMIIPFFLITCGFHTVNILTKTNSISTFKILLLYCDQMVINFIFYIRNEGSWKDIGQSLSHFAIMEGMVLIILIFYAISHYVTKQKIIYHKVMEEAIYENSVPEMVKNSDGESHLQRVYHSKDSKDGPEFEDSYVYLDELRADRQPDSGFNDIIDLCGDEDDVPLASSTIISLITPEKTDNTLRPVRQQVKRRRLNLSSAVPSEVIVIDDDAPVSSLPSRPVGESPEAPAPPSLVDRSSEALAPSGVVDASSEAPASSPPDGSSDSLILVEKELPTVDLTSPVSSEGSGCPWNYECATFHCDSCSLELLERLARCAEFAAMRGSIEGAANAGPSSEDKNTSEQNLLPDSDAAELSSKEK